MDIVVALASVAANIPDTEDGATGRGGRASDVGHIDRRSTQCWRAAGCAEAVYGTSPGGIGRLYESGLSAVAVAEECSVSKSTVLRVLRREGVEVRAWGVRYGRDQNEGIDRV
jgi:hypothetical protein